LTSEKIEYETLRVTYFKI